MVLGTEGEKASSKIKRSDKKRIKERKRQGKGSRGLYFGRKTMFPPTPCEI